MISWLGCHGGQGATTDHTVPYGTESSRVLSQAFHARLPSFVPTGQNTGQPFTKIDHASDQIFEDEDEHEGRGARGEGGGRARGREGGSMDPLRTRNRE